MLAIMTMLSLVTRVNCQFVYKSVSNLKYFSFSTLGMQNGEPANKKKMVKIGTHDGVFHCDEALACFLLKQLPTYADAVIVRSRNLDILNDCDIVVDVGGVYDSTKHRYDHHQREFTETMSSVRPTLKKKFDIKLSSAGLIYAHFGEEIIKSLSKLPDDGVKVVYEKVYEYFIQEIDAIDNGVMICDGEPKYRISTNLSSRVGSLNPRWNSPSDRPIDNIFEDAMKLAGKEFLDSLDYYSTSWWPAKYIVQQSILNRNSVHASGKIIELETFVPWKEHMFDIEKELNLEGEILYAIYKDKSSWRVICVPNTPNSFICRRFLREEWRGLRDEELSTKAGIPGSVFCHSTGFIGGNNTREGALQMAVKSLE